MEDIYKPPESEQQNKYIIAGNIPVWTRIINAPVSIVFGVLTLFFISNFIFNEQNVSISYLGIIVKGTARQNDVVLLSLTHVLMFSASLAIVLNRSWALELSIVNSLVLCVLLVVGENFKGTGSYLFFTVNLLYMLYIIYLTMKKYQRKAV